MTSHTLDALASGPTVCAELAVELAQAGPQFTQVCTITLIFEVVLCNASWGLACVSLLISIGHHCGLSQAFNFCTAKMIMESIMIVVATLQCRRGVLVIFHYSADRVRARWPPILDELCVSYQILVLK